MSKRILFISGSLGLEHVITDIAVANEIRSHRTDIDFPRSAAHPAELTLEERKERLLPEASSYLDENRIGGATV